MKPVAFGLWSWHLSAMRLIAAFLAAAAVPALAQDTAQDTMSAAAFEAYTQGHTFTYASRGAPYGAEEYLPNRRVRWSFLDGRCQQGEWYQENGLICFTYDTEPDPQCWSFRRGDSGLIARFANDPAATELFEVARSDAPLACMGPDVGV